MKKQIVSIIFILLSSQNLPAKETLNEQRGWLGLNARKNITTHLDLWAEAQLRYDFNHQTMNQTLNRFGLLRPLGENHEVGILFAYVQSNSLRGTSLREYRPTLQYTVKFSHGASQFALRNRLEYRDLEDVNADSVRVRSLFRYAYSTTEKVDLVAWDEPFLNITREEWSGNRFFERNRIFLGVRLKAEKIGVELGYLNQYVPRRTKDLFEHTFLTSFFF